MMIEIITTRGSSYKHLSSFLSFFLYVCVFPLDPTFIVSQLTSRKRECVAPVHRYEEEERRRRKKNDVLV